MAEKLTSVRRSLTLSITVDCSWRSDLVFQISMRSSRSRILILIPPSSSPSAMQSVSCSPMAANKSSFHTAGESSLEHFSLQHPPLQFALSSQTGLRSFLIKWYVYRTFKLLTSGILLYTLQKPCTVLTV